MYIYIYIYYIYTRMKPTTFRGLLIGFGVYRGYLERRVSAFKAQGSGPKEDQPSQAIASWGVDS